MDARAGLGFAAIQRHLLVGFGPFLPAVTLGLEVSLGGVWRLPSFSLPEGAGMAVGWGTGTPLASKSKDWMLQGEDQHVPFQGCEPGGQAGAVPQEVLLGS